MGIFPVYLNLTVTWININCFYVDWHIYFLFSCILLGLTWYLRLRYGQNYFIFSIVAIIITVQMTYKFELSWGLPILIVKFACLCSSMMNGVSFTFLVLDPFLLNGWFDKLCLVMTLKIKFICFLLSCAFFSSDRSVIHEENNAIVNTFSMIFFATTS